MRVIYPGTFDPVHLGHVDLIERASVRFEQVEVTVFRNPAKKPTFDVAERVEMVRGAVGHLANVTVSSFGGLAVEYARERGADGLLRGLRPVLDFDYEFQMGLMNRKIAPDIETVFLLTSVQHSFLSSTLIKELAMFGGSLDGLVSAAVATRLREALAPPELR